MGMDYDAVLFYGVDITDLIKEEDLDLDNLELNAPKHITFEFTGNAVSGSYCRNYVAYKDFHFHVSFQETMELTNLSRKVDSIMGYDELVEYCERIGIKYPEPKIYLGCHVT